MKPRIITVALTVAILVAAMAGAFLLYNATASWTDAIRPPRCAVKPETLVLSRIFGPVSGESPVWFVNGSTGVWRRREPVKSIWVLSRTATGALRLQGHRLDGPGELEFQSGTDSEIVRTLDIADPWHDSMRPGGRSAMERYAFVSMYVYYPSAGCWELVARLGDREVRIVILLKTEVAAALAQYVH
jgi:hypothetical protein